MKIFFLCAICLFLPLALYADVHPNRGSLSLAGEWLFFKTAIDQPFFIISSSSATVLNGDRVANEQKWHTGYRLEADYGYANRLTNARVRWTHIPRFTDKNVVFGRFIDAVFALPEPQTAGITGRGHIREDFNVFFLDFLLDQTLCDYPFFHLALHGGVQYGYASFSEEVRFSRTTATSVRIVKNTSLVRGWGPELGVDLSYKLWRCFYLTGRGSAAILVSERKSTFFDDGTNPDSKVKNSKYTLLNPTTDLRFGLSLRTPCDFRRWFDCSPLACFGCLNLDLEVGYEIIVFYKALNRMFYVDDISLGQSTDELMDLSFHGPYVRLGLIF